MSLTHDPASGLRLFEDSVTRMLSEPRTGRPWSPPVDVVETENDIVLKADLPDVALDDIGIHVENQTLSITGERKFDRENGNKGYHRIERSYGSFVRSFTLPSIVDTEKVAADYKNGVLTVTIPKKEATKPRQIKVQSQS